MRTLVLPGRVSQPAAFSTSRASSFRNSIPISSSTRIAPSCIACTCSAPSGSVGASWLTGSSHGICLDRRSRTPAIGRSSSRPARTPARCDFLVGGHSLRYSARPGLPGMVRFGPAGWPRRRFVLPLATPLTTPRRDGRRPDGWTLPECARGRIRYTLRRFEPRAAHSLQLSSNASGTCAFFQSQPPAV